MRRTIVVSAGAGLIALALVGCSSSGNTSKSERSSSSSAGSATTAAAASTGAAAAGTVTPGVLTIAFPDFPYPGMAAGSNPSKPTGGYFVDVATALAKQMNLKIKYEGIDFNAMIGGQAKNYDIAMDSFSITPARQSKFDMTIPIYHDHIGLMTKKSTNTSTAADIRNLTLGSCGGCDTFQYITTVIKPHKTPRAFDQDLEKYMAVENGQIGGALGDVPTILAKLTVPQFKGLKAACKLPQVTNYAFILNKGAKVYPQVQSILTSLNSAGTLAALQKKDLLPTMGGVDPDSVPNCPNFG